MSQKIYLKDPQILYNMYPSMLNRVNQDPGACCVCGGTDHVKRFGYFHAPAVEGYITLQSEIVEICADCVHKEAIKARKLAAIFAVVGAPIVIAFFIFVRTTNHDFGELLSCVGLFLLAFVIGAIVLFFNSFSAESTAWNMVHERNLEGHVYWDFDETARHMAIKMNADTAKQWT